jgi:hypothetical protein
VAPFYSLSPGLGKRAAMLFLDKGCGVAAAICDAVCVAVRASGA